MIKTTHVAEVPAVSTVVAPFVTCDIALPAFAEGEQSFRFSVLKDRPSFTLGDVFIQSPYRGALLLGK